MAFKEDSVSNRILQMKVGDEITFGLGDISAIYQAMYRARRKLAPETPKWFIKESRQSAKATVKRLS